MKIIQAASPGGRSIRHTDRQRYVTPVCLSHASLTVVCSTYLGVQGNYTVRIERQQVTSKGVKAEGEASGTDKGDDSQSVLYQVKFRNCGNMDRLCEKFRTTKCKVHIAGNILPNNLIKCTV
jgi:hypothetical protein